MNELAKKLGIELKPFCVRSEEFPSAQTCQDCLDRCVFLGAEADEGVAGQCKYHIYVETYSLDCCEYWGVGSDMVTWTSNQEKEVFNNNIITYQEMLNYLQLTEKDGRLVPNEELKLKEYIIPPLDVIPDPVTNGEVRGKRALQENNPMCTVDVVNGEVQLHKFPDNTCVEALVSSSEPVSMIKGKVVEGDLERLLCAVLSFSKGDKLVYKDSGSIVGANEWMDLMRKPNLMSIACLKSEYEQITLDKELQEAEEELLKAQAKVDELKKRKR